MYLLNLRYTAACYAPSQAWRTTEGATYIVVVLPAPLCPRKEVIWFS